MDFLFPKPYQIVKSERYETFCAPSFQFGAKNWSPARSGVVLFWAKYAVPRQIKPGILKLTIKRGQSNFSIAFIYT